MLRALIARSGLSARKFATRVLYRNERTVRRWLAGEKMPAEVVAFVHAQSPAPTDLPRAPQGETPE